MMSTNAVCLPLTMIAIIRDKNDNLSTVEEFLTVKDFLIYFIVTFIILRYSNGFPLTIIEMIPVQNDKL